MSTFPARGTEDWDDDLQTYIDEKADEVATAKAAEALTDAQEYADAAIAGASVVTEVNGHSPVDGSVTLDYSDVGAAPTSHTHSADQVTDGTTNKAFTATEKTKLAGIASGATAVDSVDDIADFEAGVTAVVGSLAPYTVTDGDVATTGVWDFEEIPTLNGTDLVDQVYTLAEKTKLAALPSGEFSVTTAGITDSGTAGRALVQSASAADAKDYLDLTDTDINAKIDARRTADPIYVTVGYGDSDPAVVNGKILLRLAAVSPDPTVSEVFEGGTTGAASSYTFTPGTILTTDTLFIHVVGMMTSTSTGAGTYAGYVSDITGGGFDWAVVPKTGGGNLETVTTNNQNSSGVWKGTRDLTGTNGALGSDITVTMAAAGSGSTPSATHDRIYARVCAVANTGGSVIQTSQTGPSSVTSISGTLSGVDTDNAVIFFGSSNTGSAALTVTTGAFTELTPQVSSTNPAGRLIAGWAFPATSPATFSTTSSTAQKIIHMIEVG